MKPGRILSNKGEWLRAAVPGILWGVVLFRADVYFSNRDGTLAFAILGFLILGGLLLDFHSSAQSLTQPRRADFLFVGGADHPRRKSAAAAQVRANAWKRLRLPIVSLAIIGLCLQLRLAMLAGVAILYALESLLVTSVILLIIRLEWLPVSKRKFQGEGGGSLTAFGASTASLVLRWGYASARALTAWLPDPYRWLMRRQLIYLFRLDAIFISIYLVFMICLGVQFNIAWGVFVTGIFALVGCMLSLTLIQVGSVPAEENYPHVAYLMPGREMQYRSSLVFSLLIAALFAAYFAISSLTHQGVVGALKTQGFWQVLVTCFAFPFLLMAEKPGTAKSVDARVTLNFSYLGLAGSLFMFPGYGLAIALAALAFAVVRCFSLAVRTREPGRAGTGDGPLTGFPAG